jgi:hypothetical protein
MFWLVGKDVAGCTRGSFPYVGDSLHVNEDKLLENEIISSWDDCRLQILECTFSLHVMMRW